MARAAQYLVLAMMAAVMVAATARPLEQGRRLLQDTTTTPTIIVPNTTGVELAGFTFGSEVGVYTLIPKDACDISTALSTNPPDFATAMDIYEAGKNAPGRTPGTFRFLKSFATGTIYGTPLAFRLNYISYYNDFTFMDGAMEEALALTPPATSAQVLKAIPQGMILLNYMMHEVEAGMNKTQFQTPNNTNPISGAPHNVDEGWGLYAGSGSCGLLPVVRSMSKAFGVMADTKTKEGTTVCESSVHVAILSAFQKIYAASLAGNLEEFKQARDKLAAQVIIPFIQGTLKAADEVSRRVTRKQNPSVALAQAYGHWKAIEAVVAAADADAAEAVSEALLLDQAPKADTFTKINAALTAAYPKLGLTAAQVGALGKRQYLVCDGTKKLRDDCLAKCPTKPKQVCGTNGKTFKTACHARCDNVAVKKTGKC